MQYTNSIAPLSSFGNPILLQNIHHRGIPISKKIVFIPLFSVCWKKKISTVLIKFIDQ